MLTNQAQLVRDIINRDGGITHLTAQHYNIGCVRKELTRLRRAGYRVKRVTKTDHAGNAYSHWSFR